MPPKPKPLIPKKVPMVSTGTAMVRDKINPPIEIAFADMASIDDIVQANERKCHKSVGSLMTHLPKQIIDVTYCQQAKELLFLCSWVQELSPGEDSERVFYLPNWVSSRVLSDVLGQHNLIIDFYESHLPGAQMRPDSSFP